jgi:hypothetical protein
MERCESLTAKLKLAQEGTPSSGPAELLGGDLSLATRVQAMLSTSGESERERAQRGLEIALELSGAAYGFIISPHEGGTLVAHTGGAAPDMELMTWAYDFLRAASDYDETAALEGPDEAIDPGITQRGQTRYCPAPLWTIEQGEGMVLSGAIALGFVRLPARMPGAEVLQVIAQHLRP